MPKYRDLLDERRKPLSAIWFLAWPIMLEQVLIMLIHYVDTAMVGGLGPQATAAVALTSPANMLLNGIFAGVSIGFSVPVGRYIGSRNMDMAKRVIRQAVLSIGICGGAMTAVMLLLAPYIPVWMGGEPEILADATSFISVLSFSYVFSMSVQICGSILRCTGDTRTPLVFNVSTNIINMALNFLLIYPSRTVEVFGRSFSIAGAGLGVAGSALASVVALSFSGLMLLRALFRENAVCRIALKDGFRLDKVIWGDMLKLGMPVALERVTLSAGQVAMTAMATALGTDSLAAHSLAITAESITYMPSFGFAAAATTLVAQSLGAGKPRLARRFADYCTVGCVLFMSSMGFLLFFGGDMLISLFTPSAAVVAIGAAALRVEALAQPLYAVSQIGTGILRGARQTKLAFIVSLIGMWAVRIPTAYLMSRYAPELGLTGLWIGMASDLSVRGLLILLLLRGGRWAGAEAPEPPAQTQEA
ncbi:MAG: Multidrug resistance protein MdtK [Firmicutes bacterium ADurb.Bin248]|nr:MAG: Multidrug resistance protein MdtK [Firmicutes bacterium ADurb.Bin248]HOG00192.1 MATE family efflux transporter [Clostridia bacterium]HPK15726.1 MATE family efflux transporter [Clostridia bacterium]